MPLDRRAFFAVPAAAPLAAMVPGPARAQPRAVNAALALDATEFGLVPGAPGDQSDALQTAIDQAAAGRVPLLLPPGDFAIRSVRLRDGSVLIGQPGSTRLVATAPEPVLTGAFADRISLRDLSIQAPATAASDALVELSDVRIAAIDGLDLSGGTGRGVSLSRCGGHARDCRISGTGQTGLFAIDATGLEISHNTVEDCGNNGIQVWRSSAGEDGSIVAHNRIRRIRADEGGSGQNGNGINVYRAGSVIVTGNRIEDCAFSAVRVNSGSNCQITGNSCTRLGEVALYVEFAFEGAVVSGNLVDTAATGIVITNFNDGGRLAVVSGNVVRNLFVRDHADSRGNGIGAEADTLITGNVVENAPTAGIALGWDRYQRDLSATGNILRECGDGISVSVTDGAGGALISGNLIAGARGAAIQGYDRDTPVGGDLIDDAGGHSHLSIAGNTRT